MASTENIYTGDGSTVLFSFTFPYLNEADIKVSLDGADTTAYTLANATTVQMNAAPAVGIEVRVYRDSDLDNVEATFFPGSAIRAADLNENFLQALYLNQETRRVAQDATTGAIADGSIGTAKLASEAVSTAKLASSAVTDAKIATGAVTTSKLAGGAVDNTKLGVNAVATANIQDDAITQVKIGNNVLTPRVSGLNGGPLAGFRNLLINGNPTINQRAYVSGTNTTGANQYTLDRWRVVTSGQNITFSDSAGVRTVTAPAGGVEQVIEGASIIGGTYTLSWTGTATATVNGVACLNGGNVTLTGGADTTVRFIGGTFSLAQLEAGTTATPFERRPIGVELGLCQRYYERGTSLQVNLHPRAVNAYSTSCNGVYTFQVEKRATPTISGAVFEGVTSLTQEMDTRAWRCGGVANTAGIGAAIQEGGFAINAEL